MKALAILITVSAMFLTAIPLMSSSEEITVSGKVVDISNNPLQGVAVIVKNTTNGVVTAHDGTYKITARIGNMLVFSFLGYNTEEVKITGRELNVVMNYMHPSLPQVEMSDMRIMEDVVVVGYGQKERKMVTGSTTRTHSEVAAAPQDRIYIRGTAAAPQNAYYPGGEEYARFSENKFITVNRDPLSTFSLDVDGASYSNMRRMINQGQRPTEDAIRVEELVNYFSYDYAKPTGQHPVKINYEVGPCPWNTSHKLVTIGVKAREIHSSELPPTNFVFLIDVSGSMAGRIELVKSSFKLLVNNLRPEDRVAIVTYASAPGLRLASTSGSDKQKINEAIDGLRAYGSTAGGEGIKLAYRVARDNYMPKGNNRIILATDGDFNVGVSSPEELERLIVRERESGVFLTVLGYGMGNYKDNRIQTLAEKGNGNHAYIDNIQEAHKVLVEEFGGTMHTVAKDVKLQVEFNPARVQSYRLVGYESRLLEHEDFNNDLKDAGELGVGHTVTAMYEIVPVGVRSNVSGSVDDLKYQPARRNRSSVSAEDYTNELLTVKLRYKDPDGDTSKLMEVPVKENGRAPSEDFHFASAVAMFGQLLRNSEFRGNADYDMVVASARKGLSNDEHGYRREFIRLAESAKGLGN